MDYFWHIVKSDPSPLFIMQGQKKISFTALFQKIIIILYTVPMGGFLINTNDSTITAPSSFQNSISDLYSVSEQECLSIAETFKGSVEGNSATSDWLQKTFCSDGNKAGYGPSSSSKDCSLNFPGSRIPALSGNETD